MNDYQQRKWINSRDAIAIGMFSVLSFLIETTLGLVIYIFSSVPLVGGLASGFFDAILIFLAIFLVPRRGAALLFATLLLALSTVTPSFGPPGIYKLSIGIGLGIVLEGMLFLFGRSKPSYIIATATAFALSIPATFFAWLFFDIPGSIELRKILPILTAIYFVIGAIGAMVGAYIIYDKRLCKHNVILCLRAGKSEAETMQEDKSSF